MAPEGSVRGLSLSHQAARASRRLKAWRDALAAGDGEVVALAARHNEPFRLGLDTWAVCSRRGLVWCRVGRFELLPTRKRRARCPTAVKAVYRLDSSKIPYGVLLACAVLCNSDTLQCINTLVLRISRLMQGLHLRAL